MAYIFFNLLKVPLNKTFFIKTNPMNSQTNIYRVVSMNLVSFLFTEIQLGRVRLKNPVLVMEEHLENYELLEHGSI